MLDSKDRYRSTGYDRPPEGIGLFAQVRPSSGLRYPRLEMDRWYPIRRQDDLGCFIQIGNSEMYLERGHYLCREGRRGSDHSRQAERNGAGMMSLDPGEVVEGLARGA